MSKQQPMSKHQVKRPRMSSSSDSTDSDAGKHHDPGSGDTENQRNAGIGQIQENPGCSTVASCRSPDVRQIDGKRMCKIDSQEFMEIQKNILFADKTAFIYEVFHAGARVLHLYAPRRFGKSTFLDTIEACVSIKMDEHNDAIRTRTDSEIYKLFMSLELGKRHPQFVKQHCGRHPVIRMSFEDVGGNHLRSVECSLKSAVCKLFQKHKYLVKRDKDDKWVWVNRDLLLNGCKVETFLNFFFMENGLDIFEVKRGLLILAKLLHIHFQQKVVILLDECDTPIMKAVQSGLNDVTVKSINFLIGGLLKNLKGKHSPTHIQLSVLTSCTRLSSIFNLELNNVDVFFLYDNEFSKLYGFTKEEILKMVSHPELKSICDESHVDKFDTIRDMDGIGKWYDGYVVLHDEETNIYCSHSVLNYMHNSIENNMPLLNVYRAGGGWLTSLGKLFEKKEVRESIQLLLDGEHCLIVVHKVTIDNILGLRDAMQTKDKLTVEQVHFFLLLLADDGILNIIDKNDVNAVLIIPNYESKAMIERQCYTADLFKSVYRMKLENMTTYINTLQSLLIQSVEEACRKFVNAVSNLYSGDAQLPANESEFRAHLHNLAWQLLGLEKQRNRSAVVSEEESESSAESNPYDRYIPYLPKCKSQRGRNSEFDILVTFGSAGVIFELKYDHQSAEEALGKIYMKGYCREFEKKEHAGVKRKIYVGLHMDNKRKVTMSAWLNGLGGKIVRVASDD